MPGTHVNCEVENLVVGVGGRCTDGEDFRGSFLAEVTFFPPFYSQSQGSESRLI